ncbi:hypothetical protein C8R45DRAFT_951768 [Mycena sanguinolenta]|nr:hypothetical protein C8R45DRAFT_951768 [Mycena sanguinolenta]
MTLAQRRRWISFVLGKVAFPSQTAPDGRCTNEPIFVISVSPKTRETHAVGQLLAYCFRVSLGWMFSCLLVPRRRIILDR